ncbi:MAG TPA: hypothetical protein VHM25_20580, partial [Polyangiaceae bacterium]|nr:hypothetical protein [Polyangiaceae bacterium]
MIRLSASRWSRLSVRSALSALSLLISTQLAPGTARAEGASSRLPRSSQGGGTGDGVYGRFDGDLDL